MLWRKLQNCIKCIHSSFACCMIREGIRGRREREREGRGMSTKSVLKCVSSASGKVSEIFERRPFGWGEMDRYLDLDFSKTDFNLSKIVNVYLFLEKSLFFVIFLFCCRWLNPTTPLHRAGKRGKLWCCLLEHCGCCSQRVGDPPKVLEGKGRWVFVSQSVSQVW